MLKRTSALAALLLLSSCTRPSAPAPEAAKPEAEEPVPETEIVAGKPRPEDVGGDTSPPPPEGTPRCSASSLNPEPRATRSPLPGPVESMRRRIIAEAANCGEPCSSGWCGCSTCPIPIALWVLAHLHLIALIAAQELDMRPHRQ
jgi:hypothetical protein